MSELPSNWTMAPIAHLLEPNENGKPFQQGWSPQCENYPASDGNWGVLKTTAIQPGQFWDHENKALPETLEPRRHLEVRVGDLLMTCAGPRSRCGVVCLVERTRSRLLMSGKMYRFRPYSDAVLPHFLLNFIQSNPAQLAIDAMKTGINDSGLNLTHDRFSTLQVPVAPLAEQRRIVAKIEELFSELDKGVEALTTAREQLKAYRQSVLKHAFEEKFIPDSAGRAEFSRHPLGELIDFLTSGSRGWADYYANDGDVFIRAQNLKHDRLDLSDTAYVQLPEGNTEGVRTKVSIGDVLITITGANVTKTGIVDRELGAAYVSQHVALCRPSERLLSKYLYWFLLAEAGGRKQLNGFAYGAGKPGLNLDNIRSVVIPLPSLIEQAEIVRLLEEKLLAADMMEAEIEAGLARADNLRQSILKRAFSGKLVPQDPDDEPASSLLARIKAERVAEPIKISRRKREAAE